MNTTAIISYDCYSPLGLNLADTWDGVSNNRSGIGRITRFDPDAESLHGVSSITYAGQIPATYDDLAGSSKKFIKSPEPSYHCVPAVSKRTFEAIGFNIAQHDPQRVAIVGATALTSQFSQDVVSTTKRPYANFILNQCHNIPLAVVSKEFGIQGPSFSIGGACASSNQAIFLADHFIKTGLSDCALVVGFEFPVLPICVGGFEWLNALYKRDHLQDRAFDDPQKASRPFSVDRRGFLLAEGVGAVFLSEVEYARKLNWPIKAKIKGGYLNSDAEHLTRISPENVAICMRRAMEVARCDKEEIDCVNAHATSTTVGDAAELQALSDVFGNRLRKTPVVANKSQLGHSLGAASILELILAVEGMNQGVVLPSLNYIQDPQLPEAFIPGESITHKHQLTLLNSFGFGGTNASLVVGLP